MSTATLSLVKVAWIRAEGYPVGRPAPGRLNCRCKGAPLTQLKPEQGDVRCACGALYSWDGWVIEPAPKGIYTGPTFIEVRDSAGELVHSQDGKGYLDRLNAKGQP